MRASASGRRREKSRSDGETERFLDAWFALRQVIQAANFNRFHQAGISATQFMILNIVPETAEGMTIGALASKTNLAAATIVKTVDSLEARGMVTRVKSESDRRLVLVKITTKGRKLQNAAGGQFRDHVALLFKAMSSDDRAALVTGLENMVRAAKSLDEVDGKCT